MTLFITSYERDNCADKIDINKLDISADKCDLVYQY